MNKLRNKIFCVISGILTIFLISILCIFNLQNYKHEQQTIENSLIRMNPDKNKLNDQKMETFEINENRKNEMYPKVFMDQNVYVITLNEKYEIQEITNHSQTNNISDKQIQEIVQNIITNNKKDRMYIGNLYSEKYSYSLKNSNTIVIIENEQANERLTSNLKSSILIFIMLEIVIIFVSIKLTNWIIKPVIDTFNKQKQFIADASHELKTPLAVIIASSEALENEPEEKKWLNNIKSEAERMNNLVTDLLDMAKSEESDSSQYLVEDLSKIIEKSILTFESLMYEKNIKLDYKIEENILFNCNSNQMKQVARNTNRQCNKI